MCLISSAPPSNRRSRYIVTEEDAYDAPRPVSYYHGGRRTASPPRRVSTTYVRRSTSSIPAERTTYRTSRYSTTLVEPRASERDVRLGRSHSIRSKKSEASSTATNSRDGAPKHRFAMSSLRGMTQPELSRKLYKLIKTQNSQIGHYESAARESHSVASQLSEWGESTEDDAVSDISDKLAVLLAEIAEQEDLFAQNLEESRGVLKQIRNTESSVQPSRNHKLKIQDEIQKLKYKEPESPKLVTLEQELVRAEAQSLVAEAQLTNITRQKLKEAYDLHTAAIIERAEKQIVLAKQARRLLDLLDDTPILPGEDRQAFARAEEAREVLNDAEASLRSWAPSVEPIQPSGGKLGANLMPGHVEQAGVDEQALKTAEERVHSGSAAAPAVGEPSAAPATVEPATGGPPYPTTEPTAV